MSACDSGGVTSPAEQERCEDYDATNFNEPGECEYPPDGGTDAPSFSTLRAGAEANEGITTIGVAVAAGLLGSNAQYTDTLAAQFNAVTPENAMKWYLLRPDSSTFDFETADRIVAFAQENDMEVRGHTLVWHSQLPAWLTEPDDPWTREELLTIMENHIKTVVTHYEEEFPGVVTSWDVVNEAVEDGDLRSSLWLETIGPEYINLAFQWAREAASDDVALYYNDYSISGGGQKEQRVYQLASDLVEAGAPIDGVGFQSHLAIRYEAPSTSELQARLEDYAELGLQTAITEIDVGIDVEGEPTAEQLDQQAEYYRRYLQACINASNCSDFRIWGFTDVATWREGLSPLIYDANYERKPAFDALIEVLGN